MLKALIFSVWMAHALSCNPFPSSSVSFWTEFQTGAAVREFVQDNPDAYRIADNYVCDWFYRLVAPIMGWE